MHNFAFICTRPKGWEHDDLLLFLAGVVGFIAAIAAFRYANKISKRWLRILAKTVSIAGIVGTVLYLGVIVYLAPC